MPKIYNISDVFDRETQVLSADEQGIICAVDGRGYNGNLCSLYFISAESGESKKLLDLEGTRLNESFDTFNMTDDWFYAITVDENYHVGVKQIEKKGYSITKIHEIIPMGEALRIFPVNEKNIIVVEEVSEVSDIKKHYPDLHFSAGYANAAYILNLKTGRRTFLTGLSDYPLFLDAHLWHGGKNNAYLTLLCADEDDRRERLLWISISELTRPGNEKPKKLQEILPEAKTVTYGGMYDNGAYFFAELSGDREHIHRYKLDTSSDCPLIAEDIVIEKPSDGRLVCSSYGGHVWQLTVDEQGKTAVKNLSDSAADFTYPSSDGEFEGVYLPGIAVTADYETTMVRGEPLFKEIQVIHDLEKNTKLRIEGSCDLFEKYLVLKRSFLRF